MVNWFSPWNLLSRTHVRLNQPVLKEHTDDCPHVLTAQEAWGHIIKNYGWSEILVALKEIESVGIVNNDGTAFGWRFCVDLLDQQGNAVAIWEALREQKGCVVGNRLRCTCTPYPAIGSPVYQIVSQGMGSEKILDAAWKQMRENSQDLCWNFVDSDQIALELFEKGWVGSYQLRTARYQNVAVWEAFHNEQKLVFSLENSFPVPTYE